MHTMPEKQINILYPMSGGAMGGSHIALLYILKHLPKHYRPVLLLNEKGAFYEALKELGFNEVHIAPLPSNITLGQNTFAQLWRILRASVFLRRFMAQHRISVVHVSDDALPVLCIFATLFSRIKCIWHHHNMLTGAFLETLALKKSPYNIFVSKYLKSFAPVEGPVIYNPVTLPQASSGPKQLHAPMCIGFFSNLYERKKPHLMVDAIALARKEGVDCVLHIFGDEREITFSALTQHAQRLDISPFVHLHPFQRNVSKAMAHMDLIVAPARDEPFGRVPIEAMACGTPVIASRTAGHLEIIDDGENGLFFEPDDLDDLARCIVRLATSPALRERITVHAQVTVKRKFGLSSHMEQITQFYSKTLA